MIKELKHPLITQKLTIMRDKNTSHKDFRQNLNEIASLMTYEVLREYKIKKKQIITATGSEYIGAELDKEIVIVPILRAGLGMVQGILDLVPQAKVGHIGMYRDEKTFEAKPYFYKMPSVAKDSHLLLVDPMVATAVSALGAITKLKKDGFTNITFVALVAVQEGLNKIKEVHPHINIFVSAIDPELDEKKYIRPGLGDAGDRIFGTK